MEKKTLAQALTHEGALELDKQRALTLGFLDLSLVYGYFRQINPHYFSKTGLYRAVDGSCSRPENYELTIGSTPRDRELAHEQALALQEFLVRHQSAYIKHEFGSGGHRLLKLALRPGWLDAIHPQSNDARQMQRKIDNFYLSDNDEDFLQCGIDSFSAPNIVTFAIMKLMADQPLDKILRTIVLHGLDEGEHVVEAPIQIPLVDERTWEIRHIVQSPQGKPQVSASFAKLGASKDFSNILAGGEAVLPQELITHLHQNHLGVSTGDAHRGASDFLSLSSRASLRVTSALNRYMSDLASLHLEGFPPELFYAREICVDITGQFTPNGRLLPVLGELQFLPLPQVSYEPELAEVNPRQLDLIRVAAALMRETDLQIVQQYAKTSE